MEQATVILTCSGGVHEEAPSLGKPVLVMRETTVRPEGVSSGNARVVGVGRQSIATELRRLLRSPADRATMSSVRNPYGDGHAAKRIVEVLSSAAGVG